LHDWVWRCRGVKLVLRVGQQSRYQPGSLAYLLSFERAGYWTTCGCELHHRVPQLESSNRVKLFIFAVHFNLHQAARARDSQPAPEVVAMVGRARLVVAPVGSHEERESLTGSPEGLEGAESGGVKRKSAPPETGSKFKVVGTMVVAMQRFQGPLAVWHLRVSRLTCASASSLCGPCRPAILSCPPPSPCVCMCQPGHGLIHAACVCAAALNPQVTFGQPASSGETSSGHPTAAASPAHRGGANTGLQSAASSGLKTSSGELQTATSADSSERRRTSWSGAHADKMPKHGGRRRHIASLVTLPLPQAKASAVGGGHES